MYVVGAVGQSGRQLALRKRPAVLNACCQGMTGKQKNKVLLRGQALYAEGTTAPRADCAELLRKDKGNMWGTEQESVRLELFQFSEMLNNSDLSSLISTLASEWPLCLCTVVSMSCYLHLPSLYVFALSRSSHLSASVLPLLLLCSCPPWCSHNPPVAHQRRGTVGSCPWEARNQLPPPPASSCLCRAQRPLYSAHLPSCSFRKHCCSSFR